MGHANRSRGYHALRVDARSRGVCLPSSWCCLADADTYADTDTYANTRTHAHAKAHSNTSASPDAGAAPVDVSKGAHPIKTLKEIFNRMMSSLKFNK